MMDFGLCKPCPKHTDTAETLITKESLYGETFIIKGSADLLFEREGAPVVVKSKRIKKVRQGLTPSAYSKFLAEGCLTSYLASKEKNCGRVTLILEFCDAAGQSVSFSKTMDAEFLRRAALGLLGRCAPFAAVHKRYRTLGRENIINMPFPHTFMRDGQRELINEVYRRIKKCERLLCVAPTGTGKTVSVLYPSVKALGADLCDKIFYLTAKTVTAKNALETLGRMNRHVPELRAVLISAKDRCCPAKDKKNPFTVERCSPSCPRLSESALGEYRERVNRAIFELLEKGAIYESVEINAAAEKYSLCPYELSLELSEYCQVIVCDYNYVFDSRVCLKRYFESESGARYVFLIDEAHNLPDRAREMYRGDIRLSDFLKLDSRLREIKFPDASFFEKSASVIGYLEEIKRKCSEQSELTESGGYGFNIDGEKPEKLAKALREFSRALYAVSKDTDDPELSEMAERLSESVNDAVHAAEFFSDKFTVFSESVNGDVRVRIMCLDPSEILDGVMKRAVSSVLFSATLTPTDYFADITGCRGAGVIELDSPYSPSNLCIAAVDTVSTRYVTRGETAERIAELITAAVGAKEGNYMVYFPSYEYMNAVLRAFLKAAPKNISVAAQKQGMSTDARKKFLSFFESGKRDSTLVGFCVLGGVFSEGVDLPDEMLIGAVLVGTGLPGISSELNIMRDYYERTREDGYGFAYVYPGIIKVLQAAGRVIRSETDRGVVVLIDDRYSSPELQKLFPSHWSNIGYVGNAYSLSKYLKKFWDKTGG